MHFSDAIVQRYLRVLGLSQGMPSFETLSELTAAHLTRIPFENISKLWRLRTQGFIGVPDVEVYLEGIERYHFGGTCYANNYNLYRLLLSLGYEVKLCGADMSAPDVHMVIMATVGGREYLVDVGYGAPFFEPMPRDLNSDYEVLLGRERFVLRPQDANGNSRLDMYRDGVVKHGYTAKPATRDIGIFEKAIADSFNGEATFMNAVLAVKQWSDSSELRSVVIHNFTVTESRGTDWSRRTLADRDELGREIERQFGIPAEVTRTATEELADLQDAWG